VIDSARTHYMDSSTDPSPRESNPTLETAPQLVQSRHNSAPTAAMVRAAMGFLPNKDSRGARQRQTLAPASRLASPDSDGKLNVTHHVPAVSASSPNARILPENSRTRTSAQQHKTTETSFRTHRRTASTRMFELCKTEQDEQNQEPMGMRSRSMSLNDTKGVRRVGRRLALAGSTKGMLHAVVLRMRRLNHTLSAEGVTGLSRLEQLADEDLAVWAAQLKDLAGEAQSLGVQITGKVDHHAGRLKQDHRQTQVDVSMKQRNSQSIESPNRSGKNVRSPSNNSEESPRGSSAWHNHLLSAWGRDDRPVLSNDDPDPLQLASLDGDNLASPKGDTEAQNDSDEDIGTAGLPLDLVSSSATHSRFDGNDSPKSTYSQYSESIIMPPDVKARIQVLNAELSTTQVELMETKKTVRQLKRELKRMSAASSNEQDDSDNLSAVVSGTVTRGGHKEMTSQLGQTDVKSGTRVVAQVQDGTGADSPQTSSISRDRVGV